MNTNAEKPDPAAAATIPHPPGGGSWTWDDANAEWVSNAPEVKPAEQVQE